MNTSMVVQLHYLVLIHCDYPFGLISNIAESQRMNYITAHPTVFCLVPITDSQEMYGNTFAAFLAFLCLLSIILSIFVSTSEVLL